MADLMTQINGFLDWGAQTTNTVAQTVINTRAAISETSAKLATATSSPVNPELKLSAEQTSQYLVLIVAGVAALYLFMRAK